MIPDSLELRPHLESPGVVLKLNKAVVGNDAQLGLNGVDPLWVAGEGVVEQGGASVGLVPSWFEVLLT